VRGDSAYARDEIMSWCEEHNVDYVLGLPSNQRLRMTHELEKKQSQSFERCQTVAPPLRPTPWFRSLLPHLRFVESISAGSMQADL